MRKASGINEMRQLKEKIRMQFRTFIHPYFFLQLHPYFFPLTVAFHCILIFSLKCRISFIPDDGLRISRNVE